MQTNVVTAGPTLTYSRDYAEMLRELNLDFATVDEHYLRVGEPKKVQGWLLHLSVIKSQAQRLMEVVLPLLIEEKVPFRIVKDYRAVKESLDGLLGYHQLGKIVTIYYEDDSSLVIFTKMLIEATKEFMGPAIPTDAYLGSIVYTRYGGMNPVLRTDSAGYIGRYTYNAKGELEMETYEIPFALPTLTPWPFHEIVTPPIEKGKKILYNNYLITSLLKQDAKGDVYKALRVKRFYPEWCIVKEGRRNMWSDDYGRDIQERLRWQYHLQKDLYGQVSVPEPYDLFEEKEGTYMVMQFVKGDSLHDVVQKTSNERNWRQLEKAQKLILIRYLLQVISQCEKLHKKGYVHRDLALSNFIVNRKNNLVLIDLELAYSLRDMNPSPPFRLGTPGFMSPEQIKTVTPTEKEDIYALGAVMIELFTSIHSRKFGIYDPKELKDNMQFFIGHEGVACLIAQCMHADPQERPVLSSVKKTIEQYQQELIKEKKLKILSPDEEPRVDRIKRVLEESLDGVCDLILENSIRTKYKENEERKVPESALPLGWYTGMSGVLYVLAQAGPVIQTPKLKKAYEKGAVFIERKLTDEGQALTPGLYMGAAGAAMYITSGLKNNWITDTPKWKSELLRMLQMAPTRLDLAHGIAGQGMAVIRSLLYLPEDSARALLQQYADTLVNGQQKDGSWVTDDNAKLKSSGLSLGSAGIIFFLLEYTRLFPHDTWVNEALLKGLDWLRTPAKTAGNYLWLKKNNYKTISFGLDGDIAGTALCFIKAYTILKNPDYKKSAEEVLQNIPIHLVNNELSMSMGLAGLGEVYLEAVGAFESEKWKQRVDWIADLILNTSCLASKKLRYWVVSDSTPAATDFMNGAGGVLHFLLRYLHPSLVSLPINGLIPDNKQNS